MPDDNKDLAPEEEQYEGTQGVSLEDLTAERDSLAEELTQLKADFAALKAELQETKKVNYSLARQIDASQEPDDNALFKEALK